MKEIRFSTLPPREIRDLPEKINFSCGLGGQYFLSAFTLLGCIHIIVMIILFSQVRSAMPMILVPVIILGVGSALLFYLTRKKVSIRKNFITNGILVECKVQFISRKFAFGKSAKNLFMHVNYKRGTTENVAVVRIGRRRTLKLLPEGTVFHGFLDPGNGKLLLPAEMGIRALPV